MPLGAIVTEGVPSLSQVVGKSLGTGIGTGIGEGLSSMMKDKKDKSQGMAAGKLSGLTGENLEAFASMSPKNQELYMTRESKKKETYDPEKLNNLYNKKYGILDDSQLLGDSQESTLARQKKESIMTSAEYLISIGTPVNTAIQGGEKAYNDNQESIARAQQETAQKEQSTINQAREIVDGQTFQEGLAVMKTPEDKFQFAKSRNFSDEKASRIAEGDYDPALEIKEKKEMGSIGSLVAAIPKDLPESFREDIVDTMILLKANKKLFTEDGVEKLMEAGLSEYDARANLNITRVATDDEMKQAKAKAQYNEKYTKEVLRSMGLTSKK